MDGAPGHPPAAPRLRDFAPGDGPALARVALAAYAQFRDAYDDWDRLSGGFGTMTALAATGETIVATLDGEVVGGVTYVGPGRPKKEIFPVECPVVRMLMVSPAHRGRGIGRALMEECVRRAERDGAPALALHTAEVMEAAIALYRALGFEHRGEAPPVSGLRHAVYVKPLTPARAPPPAPR